MLSSLVRRTAPRDSRNVSRNGLSAISTASGPASTVVSARAAGTEPSSATRASASVRFGVAMAPRTVPGSRPGGAKYKASKWVTTHVVNPLVRPLVERGWFPPMTALLETTGRRSGLPRRTPVGNGLRGDTFWIVTEHGWHADYVRNIAASPRVRVKVGRAPWREGVATILEDDDPVARLRWLRRPLNDSMLLAVGTELLVVRVDFDTSATAA